MTFLFSLGQPLLCYSFCLYFFTLFLLFFLILYLIPHATPPPSPYPASALPGSSFPFPPPLPFYLFFIFLSFYLSVKEASVFAPPGSRHHCDTKACLIALSTNLYRLSIVRHPSQVYDFCSACNFLSALSYFKIFIPLL